MIQIKEGVSAAAYHAIDACSASRLKDMRRSAAHCRYRIDHPQQSPAMAFGTLLHAMALEPDVIDATFAVIPEVDRRTKAGKAVWEAFQQRCAEKDLALVDIRDYRTAVEMTAAIEAHPTARRLLSDPGRNELSCFWEQHVPLVGDGQYRLDCKMRTDRLVEVPGIGPLVVDLKTTQDASADAFSRSIDKFGYHIQAAMYLEGLARCGIDCVGFCIVAVEKDPPYGVGVYRLSDETVEQGRREMTRLLSQYANAVKTGIWAGYNNKIEVIGLPVWAFDEEID